MTPKMNLRLKDQVVLDDIVLASTFKEKLFGYMFQKKPKSKGILFQHCHSLHSFFMHFDLDLYFLDDHYCLIEKVQGFGVRQTYTVKTAVHVLEIPSGLLDGQELHRGQAFFFEAHSNPDDQGL